LDETPTELSEQTGSASAAGAAFDIDWGAAH